MISFYAGKYGAVVLLAGSALHFGAHGYVYASNYVGQKIRDGQSAAVERIAVAFGYERKAETGGTSIDEIVDREALASGLNPSLVRALLRTESEGNQYAVSSAGAIGLMQVMPFNAKGCGLKHPGELFEVEKNIKCGVKIFHDAMKAADYDPVKAAQIYNGGPKCVDKCPESIKHARKTLKRMALDVG